MLKSKTMTRLLRLLITLVGVGLGAGVAAILYPFLRNAPLGFMQEPYALLLLYIGICALGAMICFWMSGRIIDRTMQLIGAMERRWSRMPMLQMVFATTGLILGLVVAYFITYLVLSFGPSLITVSSSAIVFLVLGVTGLQMGARRYKEDGRLVRSLRRKNSDGLDSMEALLLAEESEDAELQNGIMKKFLDTSVIIDGRILDIVKTGFLEGDLVVPEFVLAELRHIADSGDGLRRARGRRGLDVLGKMQKELGKPLIIEETDYDDIAEVDVKLLRLCREKDGIVVTNDYNLNKVAGVTGLKVLNINDLANAVKPMLMAGEELPVQIVREGKEPGQGVAYLDDGTMIVVENGRRYVGEVVTVIVTTVLQTSAGRMIFAKMKTVEENTGNGA